MKRVGSGLQYNVYEISNSRVLKKPKSGISIFFTAISLISKRIFNFTINFGRNRKGEIVFLDLGELLFEKKDVQKLIEDKFWLRVRSYKWHLDGELKEYYREHMGKKMTNL